MLACQQRPISQANRAFVWFGDPLAESARRMRGICEVTNQIVPFLQVGFISVDSRNPNLKGAESL